MEYPGALVPGALYCTYVGSSGGGYITKCVFLAIVPPVFFFVYMLLINPFSGFQVPALATVGPLLPYYVFV